MIQECQRPTLIVEGEGDRAAVPRLIRETLHNNQIFNLNPAPRPKTHVDIRKLRRIGELERYVEYAARDDGDSVLLVLDCEDFCPIDIAREFCGRISAMKVEKKVGVILFRSEFESIFLHCIDEIVARFPEYNWDLRRRNFPREIEDIRNAKGMLSYLMSADRAYKETRDQEKFITALNYEKLRQVSRSFRHFESTLLWLAGRAAPDSGIYPMIRDSSGS